VFGPFGTFECCPPLAAVKVNVPTAVAVRRLTIPRVFSCSRRPFGDVAYAVRQMALHP
jgi:hypothetical protein